MSEKITFTAELAQGLKYGEAPPDCGFKVVADYEVGNARWAVIRTLVIERADGKFFEGTYRLGTGDNGERPWEHDDTAEFTEVIARQKVTTEYVSPDKAPAPEPEPDPSDPRQIVTVKFSGASDDLIEVEGCEGADEFNSYERGRAVWHGELFDGTDMMRIHAIYDGCWSFAVGQCDESEPLPNWPVRIGQHDDPGYSTLLEIDAPVGTRLVNVWPVREDS